MGAACHRSYWGDELDAGVDEHSQTLLGIPPDKPSTDKAHNINGLIQDQAFKKGCRRDIDCSARQMFCNLRHYQGECAKPLPFKCSKHAPSTINVFTDGSWVNPTKYFLGMGGAGIFWPGRTIVKDDVGQGNLRYFTPISPSEHEIAHYHQEQDGLSLHTSVGGFNGNSTRAELAAGLVVICADGPIHIGSDSKAFVDKANALINNVSKGKRFKKHWSLMSDGDLGASRSGH